MKKAIENKGKEVNLMVTLIALSVFLIVFLFSFLMPETGIEASFVVGSEKGRVEKEDKGLYSSKDILQFRSGGLILGFKEDKVYMVGMGFALIEEFVGAKKVKPVAIGGKEAVKEEGKGAPVFSGVVKYSELWDGIDLSYEAREGGLAESVFVVKPYADPGKIRLKYNARVEVEKDGSLKIVPSQGKGYFTLSTPKAWQEIGGRRVPVEVAFRVDEGKTVGFRVGEYDRNYPLIIDPTYQWHTFYGSGSNDVGRSIAVDGNGNIYVTGSSWGTWNGPSGQSPKHGYSGGEEIVVLKLNSNGVYQWHTFYGSGRADWGKGIAVDGSGNVYVTGGGYSGWNGPNGQSPKHGFSGDSDIFVLKLNTDGEYQWHTFYGSSAWDDGVGIAVDGSGNVYVTGKSDVSWGNPLHPHTGAIVVLKLDTNGNYLWHTFYGSSTDDAGFGIAVDGNGNVYVTGRSLYTWNGPNGEGPKHEFSGGVFDIFVLKLNTDGEYQWHTFYGSGFGDIGVGIAVDGNGNVYLKGLSNSTWVGPNGESPKHGHSGGEDIVVLKLNTDGDYLWHTFYGSGFNDTGWWEEGKSIAVDGSGNVYVSGKSDNSWGSPLHEYSGGWDIVIFKLNTDGEYQWHTFYGSGAWDEGYAIAVDEYSNVYVTGWSNATWGSPLHRHSGNYDIMVLKMYDVNYTLTVTKAGTGSGRVISNPLGIYCGNICSTSFPAGTSVNLRAIPNIDSIFVRWEGDPDCVDGRIIMDNNKTCIAVFDLAPKTLKVIKRGKGSGTITSNPPGINCGSDCMERYPLGTVISLTATPDPGSRFVGWKGDPDCADGTITMDRNKICIAIFAAP